MPLNHEGELADFDEAYVVIRDWLDGKGRDLRAFEALDNLWLAAKLHENPAFDWTAPR
jgi:hypothetical protein